MPVPSSSRRLAAPLLALLLTLLLIVSTAATAVAQQGTPAAAPSAATPAASPAATSTEAAIERAVAYVLVQQASDGGFLGFSGTSDPGVTADAVLALATARSAGVEVDLTAAVAYLTANAQLYAATGAGQAAKLALAITAAGGNPRDIGGVDAVAAVVDGQDLTSGVYGTGIYDHCLAMLALVAAGEPFTIPGQTFEALRATQIPDGSWSFDGTPTAGAGDSNTTAVCLQALIAAGQAEDDMVPNGVDYLRSIQLPQGFPFQPGSGAVADANSTALVVQALIAAGEDPSSEAWQSVAGQLLLFQNPSGAFRYMMDPPDDNLYATLQALPAIAGAGLPILGTAQGGAGATEPGASPTCTPDQLAVTPAADAELPCAA